MRKQIITIIALVLIVTVATTSFGIHHSHAQAHQRTEAIQHAKALADWQMKVKAWNATQLQQKQIASTTQQSDLQQQGVSELPNTGAGNVVGIAVTGGIAAYVVHQVVLRRKLARQV